MEVAIFHLAGLMMRLVHFVLESESKHRKANLTQVVIYHIAFGVILDSATLCRS